MALESAHFGEKYSWEFFHPRVTEEKPPLPYKFARVDLPPYASPPMRRRILTSCDEKTPQGQA